MATKGSWTWGRRWAIDSTWTPGVYTAIGTVHVAGQVKTATTTFKILP